MPNAQLRPITLQNEAVFQDTVKVYTSGSNHQSGMIPTQKKHPNVAVYLRCSTEDQTVDAQQSMMSAFLLGHNLNIDECELYIDKGISAKKNPSFTDRAEGSRLMKDIESGKVNQLYGFKINRFFRRMAQGAVWMDLMAAKYSNVEVVTTDCNQPLNTSQGRQWWHFSLLLSESENEARAERTAGGMQHKAEKLQKTSHAVFGWGEYDSGERNITQGRDVGPLIMMEPCWHEQAVRQWIISEYGNLSANKIASKLNGWGIKTATGRNWSHSSIRNLVNRPAKLHDQLHQDDEPKKMITAPFRTFKPAHRF